MRTRLYLSPPHLGTRERDLVAEAFATNWVAPVGPLVDRFEAEFAEAIGAPQAVAVSSGTAALHLALELSGVGPGDLVLCSSLTFVASANPILYVGARPVFIDSEERSWNMDPSLLDAELKELRLAGKRVGAVVLVHLYGQCADVDPIRDSCERYGVPLIEDAAEALGARYGGASAGTLGLMGVFSFNGNKIITTSGGGMLVCGDARLAARARFLSTQSREPAAHYEHKVVGYNYRLSNVLAGIGIGQLAELQERVARRRETFDFYARSFANVPGIALMPEAPWGRCTRWLSAIQVDTGGFGATREEIRLHLENDNIESRPVWKPLHTQPLFTGCRTRGGRVSERLFANGLCLPSGSSMTMSDRERVVERLLSTPRLRSGAR